MARKGIKKNSKGQIFSLDVMMALIIITVILGVSADAMDMASYNGQDYSLRFSLERTTVDAADILIKTPGSPDEWENYGFNHDTVPGLAKKENNRSIPNTLSLVKILKLKSNYNQLMRGKILPDGTKSNMILYPLNPSLKPLVIMETSLSNASEAAVANRTVLCDFVYAVTVVKIKGYSDHISPTERGFEWEVCPHIDHNPEGSKTGIQEWKCNHFNITADDLNSTDFYIITNPAIVANTANWGIDRVDNQFDCKEKFNNGPIIVNDKIKAVMGNNTKAVLWYHILAKEGSKNSFDAYIVGVLKGTPVDQIRLDYLGPQPCFFVLQVWY